MDGLALRKDKRVRAAGCLRGGQPTTCAAGTTFAPKAVGSVTHCDGRRSAGGGRKRRRHRHGQGAAEFPDHGRGGVCQFPAIRVSDTDDIKTAGVQRCGRHARHAGGQGQGGGGVVTQPSGGHVDAEGERQVGGNDLIEVGVGARVNSVAARHGDGPSARWAAIQAISVRSESCHGNRQGGQQYAPEVR